MDANVWAAIGSIGQATAGFLSLCVVIRLAKSQAGQAERFAEQSRRDAADHAARAKVEADERSALEIEAARRTAFLEREDAARDEAVRSVVRNVNALTLHAGEVVEARARLIPGALPPGRQGERARFLEIHDRSLEAMAPLLVELAIDKYLVRRAWGSRGDELLLAIHDAAVMGKGVIAREIDPDELKPVHHRIHQLVDALTDAAPHWRASP